MCRASRCRLTSIGRGARCLSWDFVLVEGVGRGRHLRGVVSPSRRQRVAPRHSRQCSPVVPHTRRGARRRAARVAERSVRRKSGRARDTLLMKSLGEAVADLTQRYGADDAKWNYGQPGYHYALISHPLSTAVNEETRRKLNAGPRHAEATRRLSARPATAATRLSGASFRMIVDVGDWERAVGINTPGQSGDPDNPHYRDLFQMWADDRYFPGPLQSAARRGGDGKAVGDFASMR